ncbi:hypothetical protein DLAC_06127 [Tieghemostelium lacteum]|uniref:FAD-binding PCMH-type domain-containing protein n=1 Tax=Tieghemostelium lacteum TaxID=361077 RepID=A0A151ZHJ3_TIELA|nr:hypothetical protein DLAC_06127 [Tieghemostelium lacteum]|eukprot:KYQ93436.1 hypothetical protein DLAC_06127 [Tieghemostelium lacteum]
MDLTIKGNIYHRDIYNLKEKANENRWLKVDDNISDPLMIVEPLDSDDMVQIVKYINNNNKKFTMVCGGHDLGSAIKDGILVDMKLMNQVQVDTENQTVRAGPGCHLGDVDRETSKYDLYAPLGHIPEVGLSGYTLGGGIGHMSKKYSLAVDNLLEVDIVTADGNLVKASKTENPYLFWAVCGYGFAFGAVCSFLFKVHKITQVLMGQAILPLDAVNSSGKEILMEISNGHKKDMVNKDNDITYSININPRALVVKLIYFGEDYENGRKRIEEFMKLCQIDKYDCSAVPYHTIQSMYEKRIPEGHYYQLGPFIKQLDDNVIGIIQNAWSNRPYLDTGVIILTEVGGMVSSIPTNETSYPFRDSPFHVFLSTRINEPSQEQKIREWTDKYHQLLLDHSFGDYINTTHSKDLKSLYPQNYEKIIALKLKYDPNNLFSKI